MSDTDYKLEEYRQLRSELYDREAAIRRYFLFCIVSTGSILTASATLFVSKIPDTCSTSQIGVWFAFIFLSPIIIILPLAFLMVANRRDIFFISTYLKIFYDQNKLGTKWESRIEEFYGTNARIHSLNNIPLSISLLITVSCAAFICALVAIKGSYLFEAWHLILIIPYFLLVVFWLEFSEIPDRLRKKYLEKWKEVYQNELNNGLTSAFTKDS